MTKEEGINLPEPLAPPPIIFLICPVLGVVLEFVFPYPLIPYSVAQFSIGIALIAAGSILIGWSMIAISRHVASDCQHSADGMAGLVNVF